MSLLAEPIGPYDHVLGGSNAAATLVEYGDYACSFCARAHYEVVEVLRRVGPHVRYAYRHFPLMQIHPHALLAAQAAEAAGQQGQYWPMHSILFDNRRTLEPDHLLTFAQTLGLDPYRFTRALRSGTHLPKIQHDLRSGIRSGVAGTPTFFLDGIRVDRGWDAASLTAAIRELLPPHAPLPTRA